MKFDEFHLDILTPFLEKLARILKDHEIDEIEVTFQEGKIRLTRNHPHNGTPPAVVVTGGHPAPSAPAASPVPPTSPEKETSVSSMPPVHESAEEKPAYHPIRSPIVGTFYRAPAPGEAPFVEVGDEVKKGQVLCIVEAMKVMNEIESDVDGRVVDILVKNGEPVEYGQVLFLIDPTSSS